MSTHTDMWVELNNERWGSTNLQFLNVWDSEVHKVFFLAFLVMAIAVLGCGRIYLILTEQVLLTHTVQ